jgi:hypothetical protein
VAAADLAGARLLYSDVDGVFTATLRFP